PIPGARVIGVREPLGAWPACNEDLLTESPPPDLGSKAVGTVEHSTDAAGRASFSDSDAARLAPQATGCPPGAPCMAPVQNGTSVFVVASGYLPLKLSPARDRGMAE